MFYNGIENQPERQELKLSQILVGNGKGKTPAVDECIQNAILADILYNPAWNSESQKKKSAKK